MSFVSIEFLVFFAVVAPLFFTIPYRFRWLLLLIVSYFFYSYWNASYIFLIVFTTIVDYWAARLIDQTPTENVARRKLFLALSLVTNLVVLFTFKYFNFFNESITVVLNNLNIAYTPSTLNVILPIGISFYTFQSMAYTIDVYRGKLKAEKHFGMFATFVAFFPQLVAGPINRATHLLPQFYRNHDFDYDRIVSGLRLALWGAFKKMVIADRLAIYVNAVYNNVEGYNGAILILATVFFAFQIYCDFSGYSDIAIGVARILGFDLVLNFRQPYLSKSIREFWRRWHISLSTWFRDYLYIPLGGNRSTFARTLLNMFIVFVVSGLWHGASWTFFLWGALHGGYIVLEMLWEKRGLRILPQSATTLNAFVKMLFTFVLVCFAWIFFRANTVHDAGYVVSNLFNFSGGLENITEPFQLAVLQPRLELLISLALIAGLVLIDWFDARKGLLDALHQSRAVVRWAFYYALTAGIGFSLLYLANKQDFIYFQF